MSTSFRRCTRLAQYSSPGQQICVNGRDWAVFHDRSEVDKPFNPWTSVYIGTCSYHLPKALRHDPTAENIVRPYTRAESVLPEEKDGELLPCQFCGGPAELTHPDQDYPTSEVVSCHDN